MSLLSVDQNWDNRLGNGRSFIFFSVTGALGQRNSCASQAYDMALLSNMAYEYWMLDYQSARIIIIV
jgi:hypothetical protein